MEPGDTVRLKANPGQIGTLTSHRDGIRYLVRWFSGEEKYHRLEALEPVEASRPGPCDCILKGRYGRSSDLRGAITYYRLSGRLANLIYSLNSTNTDFFPYQFKPVLNFLDSPSNGILIADEVGLGKTIEGGLIWTELRARLDARRLLVVCPAMLTPKWQRELLNRFGVRAEIVNAGALLEHLEMVKRRPYYGFHLIVSLQGARPPRGWNDAEEPSKSTAAKLARFLDAEDGEEPLVDMMIVDEAHYLRNNETQNFKFINLFRPLVGNLVLLSATPIQLSSADLFTLLKLLDEDAFPYKHSFDRVLEGNQPVIRLRDRVLREVVEPEQFVEALRLAKSSDLLEDNQQIDFLLNNPPSQEALSDPSARAELADRLDRLNPLSKVVTRTRKRDVQELRVERDAAAVRADMNEYESAMYASVTTRIRELCEDLEISSGFLLTMPQRQMVSCMAAALEDWHQRARQWDEEDASEELQEQLYELYGDVDEEATLSSGPKKRPKKTRPSNRGLISQTLVELAAELGDSNSLRNNDSKYDQLLANLRCYWRDYPGSKVVLFSFFRATLRYLEERLRKDGVTSVLLCGGMDKDDALQKFAQPSGGDILLSSEVAAEGVDLQFASLLVNYDLPWNPAKIEQRIGRIDRIGQKKNRILIWNFMYADTVDDRIYNRLLQRLNVFESALGATEVILGKEIRQLTYELLSHERTRDEEERLIDRASVVIETNNRMQLELEEKASNLVAHGDFIENKVRAANDLGRYIRGEDLFAYVKHFLDARYEGSQLLLHSHSPLLANLRLSAQARSDLDRFLNDHHLAGRTRLHIATPPRLLFENRSGPIEYGIERIAQDHPFIRFISATLSADGHDTGYWPVVSVSISRQKVLAPTGTYVYAVARWGLSGARDIERLEYEVRGLTTEVPLNPDIAEQLINAAAIDGEDWTEAHHELGAESVARLYEECRDVLDHRHWRFAEDQIRENADTIMAKVRGLENELKRKTKQIREQIAQKRSSGNPNKMRTIPADEGKIKKLTANLHGRIDCVKAKSNVAVDVPVEVSGGVIRVI